MTTVILLPTFVSGGVIGGSFSSSGGTTFLQVDDGDAGWIWFDVEADPGLGYRMNLEFPPTDIPADAIVDSAVLDTTLRGVEVNDFDAGLTGTPHATVNYTDGEGTPVSIDATGDVDASYAQFTVDLTGITTAQVIAGGIYGSSGYFQYLGGAGTYGHVYTFVQLTIEYHAPAPSGEGDLVSRRHFEPTRRG